MRAVRFLLGALGVGVAAYGAKLLLDLGFDNTRATLEWVIGGVILHDAVLAPATIVIGAAFVWLSRTSSGRLWTAPVLIAGIVVGTVTITAIPVLGSWGARADNSTLLDRNYLLGWLAFVGLAVVVTLLAVLARGRQRP